MDEVKALPVGGGGVTPEPCHLCDEILEYCTCIRCHTCEVVTRETMRRCENGHTMRKGVEE
jgi:hypothetical protein